MLHGRENISPVCCPSGPAIAATVANHHGDKRRRVDGLPSYTTEFDVSGLTTNLDASHRLDTTWRAAR
jgi:hypothetical protein